MPAKLIIMPKGSTYRDGKYILANGKVFDFDGDDYKKLVFDDNNVARLPEPYVAPGPVQSQDEKRAECIRMYAEMPRGPFSTGVSLEHKKAFFEQLVSYFQNPDTYKSDVDSDGRANYSGNSTSAWDAGGRKLAPPISISPYPIAPEMNTLGRRRLHYIDSSSYHVHANKNHDSDNDDYDDSDGYSLDSEDAMEQGRVVDFERTNDTAARAKIQEQQLDLWFGRQQENVDLLERKQSPAEIKAYLDSLPESHCDTYEEIMKTLKDREGSEKRAEAIKKAMAAKDPSVTSTIAGPALPRGKRNRKTKNKGKQIPQSEPELESYQLIIVDPDTETNTATIVRKGVSADTSPATVIHQLIEFQESANKSLREAVNTNDVIRLQEIARDIDQANKEVAQRQGPEELNQQIANQNNEIAQKDMISTAQNMITNAARDKTGGNSAAPTQGLSKSSKARLKKRAKERAKRQQAKENEEDEEIEVFRRKVLKESGLGLESLIQGCRNILNEAVSLAGNDGEM